MKTKNSLLTILILLIISSCSPVTFFQVYKTTPINQLSKTESSLLYEDNNCKVSYNLWADGGNIGFMFYNKTDQNIYLYKEESYFVLNGIANDYYKRRVFTNTASSGTSSSRSASASKSVTGFNYLDLVQTNKIQASGSIGLMTSEGFSVSYDEEKTICIPSKTSKIITEYNINDALYRDCDLFIYPTKKQIKSKRFSISDSPLIFSNKIAYSLGQSKDLVKFENEFYVSEISNFPESEITEYEYEEFCGEKSAIKRKYFKNISPDKFYIEYDKKADSFEH